MPGIVITGASSGLGLALAREMLTREWDVYNLSINGPLEPDMVRFIPTDVRSFDQVRDAAEEIKIIGGGKAIRVVVNCAAINGINYLEDVRPQEFTDILMTNAGSIFHTARAFLPILKKVRGTICNITSDAAWKPMTGSLAYNASKGAAHIMTLQLARELTRRYQICVFGVAPGKLAGTGMSQYIDRRVTTVRGWTDEEAKAYAQAGRLWPEEIPPTRLASFLAYLFEDPARHRYFSGCIIPYGA